MYPLPQANPPPSARNTYRISFGSPGALRNRTREKAPAILEPTTNIINATTGGSATNVSIKFWEKVPFLPVASIYAPLVRKPTAIAAKMMISAFFGSIVISLVSESVSKILRKILSMFVLSSIFRFFSIFLSFYFTFLV